MLGPFWRTNQDNPAAGLWRTRVPRNSSTITTASEQCQTPKRAELDRPSSPDLHSGKTRLARPISSHKGVMFGKKPVICYSPCHGLPRSEEHTSELQSRENLVCRLLLEKKKKSK